MTPSQIASYIDHTLLRPDATHGDILKICEEAIQHKFYSVCVNSAHVRFCAKALLNSGVKITAVVGFPLGAMATEAKAFETALAVREGANEIDMVIDLGSLKAGDQMTVQHDIEAVVRAAGLAPVKVIIETALLTDEQKVLACQISARAGAAFVKTSTGFSGGGATVEDVRLMKKTVGPDLQVKASGGVKNLAAAEAMIAAGATRLGTSSGVAIISGQTTPKGSY